ncbi:MAG TPA: PxKF domain-containing protein, partial [Nocardioidaceae bacterium]|nr:PxKF domain-containing protein [Nocardioidaceae bacterium]
GGGFYFGDQVVAPTCTADDGGSGVKGECTVSGFSTAVGTHTLTATAMDDVGNVGTKTLTYTVMAWRLDGFYKPVDMGVLNTVKAGSTVPLKFNVFKGGERLTANIGATFSAKKVTCGGSVEDAIEEFATTGSTSLRYDSTGQQWIQNWATPKLGAGSCYKVTLTTADGTYVSADFKLK